MSSNRPKRSLIIKKSNVVCTGCDDVIHSYGLIKSKNLRITKAHLYVAGDICAHSKGRA